MVGRDAELASLTAALPSVLAGRSHAVVISGVAGIGKTRLALEALAVARAQGFLTLSAGAAPLEQDLSYAPLVRALRPLLDDDTRRRDLVAGLPQLGRLFVDLEWPDPPPDLGDPGLERTRLYEAVRQFVRRATAAQPIALLVDDVHWLDRASQSLLGYLARCLTDSRLLLLLTRRDDEPGDPAENIPLLDTLRWAARVPTVASSAVGTAIAPGLSLSELSLPGLDESALTALAADLLGGVAPRALVTLLSARSAGVPLFVYALLSTLSETESLTQVAGRWVLRSAAPHTVPQVARTLLQRRLDILAPAPRRVMDVICLAPESTAPMVARIAGTSPTDAVDALERLRRSGLIDEVPAGRTTVYRPSHSLLAEVAVGSLSTEQRQALHAATARVLEQEGRPDVLQLAHHLLGAGALVAPATTLATLVEAVTTALHRRAGDHAVLLAQAGLDLMSEHRLPGSRTALLTALAHGAQMAGRLEEALTAMLDAAGAGHPLARAQRVGAAARIAWDLGRFDLAERCLRDAHHLIDERPAGPVHVYLAEVEIRNGIQGDRRDVLDAALPRLADLTARTGIVRARALLEIAYLVRDLDDGRVPDALGRVDGLLSLSRRLANPQLTEVVLRSLTQAFLVHGDFDAAAERADEGIVLARQFGSPTLATVHIAHLGMVRLQQGRFSDAAAMAARLIEIGEQTGMERATAMGMTQLAFVARGTGQVTEAEALLGQVGERFGQLAEADRSVFGFVDLARVLVQLDHGDASEAEKTARAALQRRPAVRALLVGAYGQALTRNGRWAEATAALDQLRTQSSGRDLTAALADRLEAQVAAAQGEQETAASLYAAAADGFDRLGMVVQAAHAWLDALCCRPVDDGRPEPEWLGSHSARELLERALRVFSERGVEAGANRARRLLRDHGGTPGSPSARRARTAELTPREEEVVRLVAAGLSNPEIAERLYISTRTVTTHLQKVYARLGIRSRVTMTRWVVEHLKP